MSKLKTAKAFDFFQFLCSIQPCNDPIFYLYPIRRPIPFLLFFCEFHFFTSIHLISVKWIRISSFHLIARLHATHQYLLMKSVNFIFLHNVSTAHSVIPESKLGDVGKKVWKVMVGWVNLMACEQGVNPKVLWWLKTHRKWSNIIFKLISLRTIGFWLPKFQKRVGLVFRLKWL